MNPFIHGQSSPRLASPYGPYIYICKEEIKMMRNYRHTKKKIYFMERRKRERSSLQSKHEGKMMVGSSPGSCTPMQVQVSISHCCTREASMNRQLQPTTSPPGLDRRELFDRFSSPSSSSSSSSSSWLHSSHSKIYSHPVIFRLVARSTWASYGVVMRSTKMAGLVGLYRAHEQIWAVDSSHPWPPPSHMWTEKTCLALIWFSLPIVRLTCMETDATLFIPYGICSCTGLVLS